MRKTWLTRVNTIILALLLAGGGAGLPVADAVFHHLNGSSTNGDRIADGEAPAGHGERCTLGVPLPTMAMAGAVAVLPSRLSVSFLPIAIRGQEPPRSASVPGATRPRAPPAING